MQALQLQASMKRASRHAGARGFEQKGGDGDIKAVAIFGDKKVTAVHGAARRVQATAAGVLKRLARTEKGLLPHNAQTFDLVGVAAFVLNDPVP